MLDQPDPGLRFPPHPGLRVFSFVSAALFPELRELKHVELRLVDGRLTQIALYYPDDIKWKSSDEFAQKTGESLKLDGSWRKLGLPNELDGKCDSFGLKPSPFISLDNPIPYGVIRDLPNSGEHFEFVKFHQSTVFRISPEGFDIFNGLQA